MNLFVTKPAGHSTPVSEELVPQFSYIHKVEGSPPLRFGGIEPTGPLPEAINFPLIEDGVGDQFECLIFGDAQPYSNREIGYVRETAGKMLATRDNEKTECLILEGDVMGDDLSLYPRFKEVISVGGVPQYFVSGNHDLDFDAEDDAHSFDTFRAEWGPNIIRSISARCNSWCSTTSATPATASTIMTSARCPRRWRISPAAPGSR